VIMVSVNNYSLKLICLSCFFIPMIFGCRTSFDESYISLVEGFEQDPSEAREAILLHQQGVVFCKERVSARTFESLTYSCFRGEVSPRHFRYFAEDILVHFEEVNKSRNVVDDLEYSLRYSLEGEKFTVRFFRSFLSKKQTKIIDSLLNMASLAKDTITSYDFPDPYIKEPLPNPVYD